jgi:hypothetical protein
VDQIDQKSQNWSRKGSWPSRETRIIRPNKISVSKISPGNEISAGPQVGELIHRPQIGPIKKSTLAKPSQTGLTLKSIKSNIATEKLTGDYVGVGPASKFGWSSRSFSNGWSSHLSADTPPGQAQLAQDGYGWPNQFSGISVVIPSCRDIYLVWPNCHAMTCLIMIHTRKNILLFC